MVEVRRYRRRYYVFRCHILINKLTSTDCSELRNWPGVAPTTTQFPIEEGVTVTLTCENGLSHVGDSVVTCNQLYYEGYKYTVRPKCEVGDSGSDVETGTHLRIISQ